MAGRAQSIGCLDASPEGQACIALKLGFEEDGLSDSCRVCGMTEPAFPPSPVVVSRSTLTSRIGATCPRGRPSPPFRNQCAGLGPAIHRRRNPNAPVTEPNAGHEKAPSKRGQIEVGDEKLLKP